MFEPERLHPDTPSKTLSSSMPCQCTVVGSVSRLTTVMAVVSPRTSTSGEPGTSTESARGSAPLCST